MNNKLIESLVQLIESLPQDLSLSDILIHSSIHQRRFFLVQMVFKHLYFKMTIISVTLKSKNSKFGLVDVISLSPDTAFNA